VSARLAKSKLNTIAEVIIALLVADPNANVRVTVEIDADFTEGVKNETKRAVSGNADRRAFKTKNWQRSHARAHAMLDGDAKSAQSISGSRRSINPLEPFWSSRCWS
jgi:hypothetical protein